jgi:hypothetical protein
MTPGQLGRPGTQTQKGDLDDSSSDEEYSLTGVRLRSQQGQIGKRAKVAPIPFSEAYAVPGLMLHPEDRLETPEEEEQREMQRLIKAGQMTAAQQQLEGAIEVKPFVPRADPDLRRRRSEMALRFGQEEYMKRYGTQPRLVRDPETGFLLPKDHIVEVKPPRMVVLPNGQVQYLPPEAPAGPAAQGPAAGEDADVKYHYNRSLELVSQLRKYQLLRKLGGA